jgi:hypothetical protein
MSPHPAVHAFYCTLILILAEIHKLHHLAKGLMAYTRLGILIWWEQISKNENEVYERLEGSIRRIRGGETGGVLERIPLENRSARVVLTEKIMLE